MPSKRAAIEWLQHEVSKGRGDEPVHLVDVRAEQRKRIQNDGPKPKTRFQIELGDPELYRQWNAEKDRILHHVKNKAIALDLMQRAWSDALSNPELDKILAALEGPT